MGCTTRFWQRCKSRAQESPIAPAKKNRAPAIFALFRQSSPIPSSPPPQRQISSADLRADRRPWFALHWARPAASAKVSGSFVEWSLVHFGGSASVMACLRPMHFSLTLMWLLFAIGRLRILLCQPLLLVVIPSFTQQVDRQQTQELGEGYIHFIRNLDE